MHTVDIGSKENSASAVRRNYKLYYHHHLTLSLSPFPSHPLGYSIQLKHHRHRPNHECQAPFSKIQTASSSHFCLVRHSPRSSPSDPSVACSNRSPSIHHRSSPVCHPRHQSGGQRVMANSRSRPSKYQSAASASADFESRHWWKHMNCLSRRPDPNDCAPAACPFSHHSRV